MAVIRPAALQQFKKLVEQEVPALRGKICAGQADRAHKLGFPSLAVTFNRIKFLPDDAAEFSQPSPSTAVFKLGVHEAICQIWLGAQTATERYTLEQKIIDLFNSDCIPGILTTTIPECHDAVVAWELEETEWQDEKAFAKKFFSVLTVTVRIPALISKGSVHTLEEIRLTLTEDLETPIAQIPAGDQETVIITG